MVKNYERFQLTFPALSHAAARVNRSLQHCAMSAYGELGENPFCIRIAIAPQFAIPRSDWDSDYKRP